MIVKLYADCVLCLASKCPKTVRHGYHQKEPAYAYQSDSNNGTQITGRYGSVKVMERRQGFRLSAAYLTNTGMLYVVSQRVTISECTHKSAIDIPSSRLKKGG